MPIGMTAVTTPDMRTRNNPFAGRVVKISRVNGWINWRYAKAVNRQRVRENRPADFRALQRPWGTRLKETPLVELGDRLYLDVKVQQRHVVFRDLITGQLIPTALLKPYLRPPAKNPRQHLRREIILRDYRLDRVAELRINGEVWRPRKAWNRLQKLLRLESAA